MKAPFDFLGLGLQLKKKKCMKFFLTKCISCNNKQARLGQLQTYANRVE